MNTFAIPLLLTLATLPGTSTAPMTSELGQEHFVPAAAVAVGDTLVGLICPRENSPETGATIRGYLDIPQNRADWGIPISVQAVNLRFMQDGSDLAACERMIAALPGGDLSNGSHRLEWVFYTADGWYFAAAVPVDESDQFTWGHGGLWILDPQMSTVEVIRI